jgi:hypothetical protein
MFANRITTRRTPPPAPVMAPEWLISRYHAEIAYQGPMSKTALRELGFISPQTHFESFWMEHLARTLKAELRESSYGYYTLWSVIEEPHT